MRILDYWTSTTLPPKPPPASASQLYAQLVFSPIPFYVNSHFHLVAAPPGATVKNEGTFPDVRYIYSYLVYTKATLNKLNTGNSYLSGAQRTGSKVRHHGKALQQLPLKSRPDSLPMNAFEMESVDTILLTMKLP